MAFALKPVTKKFYRGNFMSDVSEVLLNKLSERVTFERTGTKLYEALVKKYQEAKDKKSLPELIKLERFYHQEAKHSDIVNDVMTQVGGEMPAITPPYDLSASLSMGWLELINDPRSTFLQALEIVLQAELLNHAGWELLIELAERKEMPKIATQFQECLDEKDVHIEAVKQWVQDLTLNQQVHEADTKGSFLMEGNP
jgi:rubrerythrin